jgi:hypothetical protein
MLKIQFPFFGQGVAHGDSFTSVTMADVIKQSALALIGRSAASQQDQKATPADNWLRDETGQTPVPEQPSSSFLPPAHRTERLPSDSPLRADIGLLPLDNF